MAQTRVMARSEQAREQALRCIPGGVNSNVRLSAPPVFFARASGAMMWDVDGNDYVDYVLGQGPHFLGHANPVVNAAVAQACEHGMLYGGQHPLDIVHLLVLIVFLDRLLGRLLGCH